MSKEPKMMDGLIEGRMCHYVLPDGPNAGYHRPAVVVQVWDMWAGTCNLQVFVDGNNDGFANVLTQHRTSVRYSEDKENGTWHWIEKA